MPERGSLEEAVPSMAVSLGAQVLSPPGCQGSDVKPEVPPSAGTCSQGAAESLQKWEAEETPQCTQIQGFKAQESAQAEVFQPVFSKCLGSGFSPASKHCCLPKRGKSHLLHSRSLLAPTGSAPGLVYVKINFTRVLLCTHRECSIASARAALPQPGWQSCSTLAPSATPKPLSLNPQPGLLFPKQRWDAQASEFPKK